MESKDKLLAIFIVCVAIVLSIAMTTDTVEKPRLGLITPPDKANTTQLTEKIQRIEDHESGVTCWYTSNAIDCVPVSAIRGES